MFSSAICCMCYQESFTEGEGSVQLISLYQLFQIKYFSIEIFIYRFYKISYLNEEVDCTEPSSSVTDLLWL